MHGLTLFSSPKACQFDNCVGYLWPQGSATNKSSTTEKPASSFTRIGYYMNRIWTFTDFILP